MHRPTPLRAGWAACLAGFALMLTQAPAQASSGDYAQLLTLYREWRALERPSLRDGAPDYTAATVAARFEQLRQQQARLAAIDPAGWPREQRIDHELVRAQMNGMEFDTRWLRPWARDPAFYQSIWTEQSDTPEHEGPTHHAPVELWQYSFPLDAAAERKLAGELQGVAPLLEQARLNLTGDGHDLWLTGTATMQQQVANLEELAQKTAAGGPELRRAVAAASVATREFVGWLERQAPAKTGPSGIG
ncbi:MAG: DUF885 family protein, partial [Steroidobacteraceae bacterium]